MKKLTLALALLLQLSLFGQSTFPFDIVLEPITITNLPGMQSYAAAQHNGKWLIIGGRIDGLHQRQPWQAFNAAGHNTAWRIRFGCFGGTYYPPHAHHY